MRVGGSGGTTVTRPWVMVAGARNSKIRCNCRLTQMWLWWSVWRTCGFLEDSRRIDEHGAGIEAVTSACGGQLRGSCTSHDDATTAFGKGIERKNGLTCSHLVSCKDICILFRAHVSITLLTTYALGFTQARTPVQCSV